MEEGSVADAFRVDINIVAVAVVPVACEFTDVVNWGSFILGMILKSVLS